MTTLATPPCQVGDKLGPLSVGPVTRTTLALFAAGSGDHNEIHLDIDVARSAGMEDVFAQGMLGMAYLARLVTDTFGHAPMESFQTRFTAITPINARPICTGEVVDVHADLATIDLRLSLEDGTPTLLGTARVRLTGTTS